MHTHTLYICMCTHTHTLYIHICVYIYIPTFLNDYTWHFYSLNPKHQRVVRERRGGAGGVRVEKGGETEEVKAGSSCCNLSSFSWGADHDLASLSSCAPTCSLLFFHLLIHSSIFITFIYCAGHSGDNWAQGEHGSLSHLACNWIENRH